MVANYSQYCTILEDEFAKKNKVQSSKSFNLSYADSITQLILYLTDNALVILI